MHRCAYEAEIVSTLVFQTTRVNHHGYQDTYIPTGRCIFFRCLVSVHNTFAMKGVKAYTFRTISVLLYTLLTVQTRYMTINRQVSVHVFSKTNAGHVACTTECVELLCR